MSVLDTIGLLQARHRTIGVRAPEPEEYPDSLNRVGLPLVLTFPDRGDWQQQAAAGLRRQDRIYRVQVFVRPTAQGSGLGSAVVLCSELLQQFGELYLEEITIALANTPAQATIKTDAGNLSDDGVGVLTYAKTEYYGFEFRVGVYEKW